MRSLKLHDDRGETLVEVLAAILIATLSVALLFTCIGASAKIEDTVIERDVEHYIALSEADARTTPTAGAAPVPGAIVTIEGSGASATASVEIYGGEGMYSYKEKP